MPGLAQMKSAKAGDIRYDYQALPNGGQIHFSTEYPNLLNALHHWFDAQIKELAVPHYLSTSSIMLRLLSSLL